MMDLNDFKVLSRVSAFATSILGSRVVVNYAKGGIKSTLSNDPNKPSLIEIDTDLIKNFSDNDLRATIFHEVAHHKYSSIIKLKDIKLPTSVFEAIEEQRVESKIIKHIQDKSYNPNIVKSLVSLRQSGLNKSKKEILDLLANEKKFTLKKHKMPLYINALLHAHFSEHYNNRATIDELDFSLSLKESDLKELEKVRHALDITTQAILNRTRDPYVDPERELINYYQITTDNLDVIVNRVVKVWPKIAKLLDWQEEGNEEQKNHLKKIVSHLGTRPSKSAKIDTYEPTEYDKMIGKTFGRQLNTALLNKTKSRFHTGLKSGKFDVRQASRFLRSRIDVFKKRKDSSKKVDYHISVAIDHSGSMSKDQRLYYAQKSCYLLLEAFKTCQIKLDFYRFDHTVDKLSGIDEVLLLQPKGGTSIKGAVEMMALVKTTNPNTKKINIVLTDGDDSLNSVTVKGLEKSSNSKFVGIGLAMEDWAEENFSNMFETSITVKTPTELSSKFIALCKSLIL